MAKKGVKKGLSAKRMHVIHVIAFLVICLLSIIIFSMASSKTEEKTDVLMLSDAVLMDIEKTEEVKSFKIIDSNYSDDEMASHNLSFKVFNTLDETVDCYLILNIQNETYKNATIVDIPVLIEKEETVLDILFRMPEGNSTFSLDQFC